MGCRGRNHEPVDFFVRVLRTDTPALPPGEKSDFPKPQSTRFFYVKQLPAALGNARPSRPHLRGGPQRVPPPGTGGTCPRTPLPTARGGKRFTLAFVS